MRKTSFRAVVLKDGVNPFVDAPVRVNRAIAVFAIHGRIRFAGMLNRHPLHATPVLVRDGTHRLRERRHACRAGIEAGEQVTLTLRPLSSEQVVILPT